MTAVLLPNGKQQFFNNAGLPLAGGKLYTWAAGTTTPKDTYTTAAGNVANTNPVVLNARGEAIIFWNGAYKIELRDASDNIIWPAIDNVVALDVAAMIAAGITDYNTTLGLPSGAGRVGFSHAETYPYGTDGKKLQQFVNLMDAPFNARPGSDCTAAILAGGAYLANLAETVDGFDSLMPTMLLPPGLIIVSDPQAFTAAFAGTKFAGVNYTAAGMRQTLVRYTSTSSASDNYLFNMEDMRVVNLKGMTFESTDPDLRWIKWGPNGGGSGEGSIFRASDVELVGTWQEGFTIGGTALGSETYWDNCLIANEETGGSFFSILDTNIQAVNHTFSQCNLGGAGTIFKLRAGGLIRTYGGFSSLQEGATFFDAQGPGEKIGGNAGITIHGMNFETVPGVSNAVLVNSNSPADIVFERCGFQSFNPSGGGAQIVMGNVANQRGGRLTFEKCAYPMRKATLSNGVTVRYLNCSGPDWEWQNYLTLQAGTNSNYQYPAVEIKGAQIEPGTFPLNPADCYPGGLVTFSAHSQAGFALMGQSPNYWDAKYNNGGIFEGLVCALGGSYTTDGSFTFNIPQGTMVCRVWLYFFSAGNLGIGSDRNYKITNFDGSYEYLPEVTISSIGDFIAYEGEFKPNIGNSADNRKIIVWGKTADGSAPALTYDYGFARVEYL